MGRLQTWSAGRVSKIAGLEMRKRLCAVVTLRRNDGLNRYASLRNSRRRDCWLLRFISHCNVRCSDLEEVSEGGIFRKRI